MKFWKIKGTNSLKLLLVLFTLIPFLIIWIFTGQRLYQMQEENIDNLIQAELTALDNELQTYYKSLEYMSLQIITDRETSHELELYFRHQGVERFNVLTNMVRRISLYQASNPTISNINYYYFQDDKIVGIGNTMLNNQLPKPVDLLFTKNKVSFFGPHRTASKASDYPVISLVRELELPNSPLLYLYIETGYKQLPTFSAATLDTLDANYVMTSNAGLVTYSSDTDMFPLHAKGSPPESQLVIGGVPHRHYFTRHDSGWSISVYVPAAIYKAHIYELNFSFFLLFILMLAISFGILISVQNAIYRPLKRFEENLKIVSEDDGTAKLKPINISEFDDNFMYFQNMKVRISELIQTVQQQEQEKNKLQVSELLYKINPHFIYNTLLTLESYFHEQGYEDAEHFVNTLNQLLVYNMENTKVTTLQNELKATEQYLELQGLKYDLTLDIQNLLPDALLRSEVPSFIFQPIVENAIFHGIMGKGYLGIYLSLTLDGKISVQIANDGNPFDPAVIERLTHTKKTTGVGLSYVKRMLEEMFGDQYEIKIYTTQEGRTVVELIIPFSKGGFHA